jgi:hypothetical protein
MKKLMLVLAVCLMIVGCELEDIIKPIESTRIEIEYYDWTYLTVRNIDKNGIEKIYSIANESGLFWLNKSELLEHFDYLYDVTISANKSLLFDYCNHNLILNLIVDDKIVETDIAKKCDNWAEIKYQF